MAIVDPAKLLESLIAYPRETEWLEFKENHLDAEEAGKYLSALANAAMLHDEEYGYLVFGVRDQTHEVVGTTVRLKAAKAAGSEPLEPWLSRMLHPSITFEICSLDYEGKHVEIVRIHPAYQMPVRFKTEEWIRVDSILKPLRDYPERARTLWHITSRFTFERAVAAPHLSVGEVFGHFDPAKLLANIGSPRLSTDAIMHRLLEEGLLTDDRQGGYDATNLFALLAARDITMFPGLASKTARTTHYTGTSKLVAKDDVQGRMGYAISFSKLLTYIMDRIDHKEEMVHGTRRMNYAIPEIAVREFLVNALVHQDLTVTGAGPRVEIYSDRVKITNPGKPLVPPDRLIDAPARSRNEDLGAFMRALGLFEGRGSGVDRAIDAIEKAALTPPLLQVVEESMVVTLFAARKFGAMSKEDRVRGCYQHACLRFEGGMTMSNQSLRDRFGLASSQASTASQVISDTREAGWIKPQDEEQANRVARYLPY
ncbi:ATP-binding protein [Phenylobacterium sp.]|jgi:ATP-dependent DNA helicase RecG|uniref:ATP-binding protein n=1 Tax=Phenylobacterium sp. TaxID=1871053 RepID=UPI0037846E93